MSLKLLFGTISKVTDQADGTVLVEGIASTETVDSQGEIVKASAMAAALPDYMKFGNVREMHQAIAAGKAVACSVVDGVTHLTAHVVDAGSVAKVKAGVLQGFSIGGTVKSRSKDNLKVIDGLDLNEISLVDRPANPDATFQLCKFDKPVAPVAEPVKTTKRALSDEMKKGLYSVGYLADAISCLNNLAADAQWEADYEGDGSAIPGRLKAVVKELLSIFVDMAAEEAAELDGDVVAMAAKPGSLKKSEKLGGLLKAFVSLAKGDLSQAKLDAASALADSLKKQLSDAVPLTAALEKRATDAETAKLAADKSAADALALLTEGADALEKANKERDQLRVDLQRKGVLRVVPVSKTDDSAPPAPADKTKKSEEAPKDTVSAIKKIHAGGGFSRLP